jgi:hypothetical protein
MKQKKKLTYKEITERFEKAKELYTKQLRNLMMQCNHAYKKYKDAHIEYHYCSRCNQIFITKEVEHETKKES